jgi:hypothetical protein
LLRASRDQPGRRGERPLAASRRIRPVAPIRSCSRWGLPCRRRYRKRGALLPHRFTLACRHCPGCPGPRAGGLFSVALSLRSPPPAVSRHRPLVEPGLSSTTPPELRRCSSDRPAVWRAETDAGSAPRQPNRRVVTHATGRGEGILLQSGRPPTTSINAWLAMCRRHAIRFAGATVGFPSPSRIENPEGYSAR